MKNFLCILILISVFSNTSYSQGRNLELRASRANTELSKKIFGDSDADFKVIEIPEKWKNESAIILAQKFDYEYTVDGKRTLKYKEITRKRIKLLDKAAVEKFSTFYYYGSKNASATKLIDAFGIQVLKPDGKTRNIEKKDAIKVDDDNEVSSVYLTRLVGASLQYYKLAIADLEPGDILDYYLISNSEDYNFDGSANPMPPVITTMNSDYSIQSTKLNFIVDRGFFINFKSTNGAPDLTKNQSVDRNTYSFSLIDKDRNKIEDARWLYQYRELPTIKFQVCFSQIGKESRYFLGKVDEPTTVVNMKDIASKINFWFNEEPYLTYFYVDFIKNKMKLDHGKPTNKEDIIKWCYYYFRNIAFSSTTMDSYSAEKLGYMPSPIFAKVMVGLLKNYEIKADVCVAPARSISKIDDLVLAAELDWFVKVGNDYIFSFDKHSNYKDIDPSMEGQDAYLVKIDNKEANQIAQKIKVPYTTTSDNIGKYEYDIKMDDDFENVIVNVSSKINGSNKSFYSNTVLKHYNWEINDYKSYGGKNEDKNLSRNKNKIEEAERQKKAKEEEDYKNTLEVMKEDLMTDFSNVVSYDAIKIENDGRTSELPELSFTENYKLGDIIKKIGNNYSVSIGSLIGSQVALENKELKRDYNIWISFARSSNYTINFKIPEGYKVEGLDALNNNIDNNTGSFIVSVKSENQMLTLNINKTYKQSFLTKEDWPKMLSFLEAAYNFSQKKIILVKT